jgi:hypothetical protein
MPQIISKPLTPNRTKRLVSLLVRCAAVSLGLALLLFRPPVLSAQTGVKTYQTTYALVQYQNDKDLFTFTRNIGSGLSFLRENPEKNPLLAKNRVDRIVDMVSGLLDMHPPNLHFSIQLFRTQAELDTAWRNQGMMGSAPMAFYAHATRSIAVSLDNITDRILAHEIAHAIICHYFGTPPPMRMQEVLAQYVDKHLGEE